MNVANSLSAINDNDVATTFDSLFVVDDNDNYHRFLVMVALLAPFMPFFYRIIGILSLKTLPLSYNGDSIIVDTSEAIQ